MIKLSSVIHFFIFTAICGLAFSYSNLYLFHIAMALMLFSLLATAATQKRLNIKSFPTKFHYFFVFMLAYFTMTLLWTISLPSTLTYLFYIVCGGVLALTVIYYGDTEESLTNVYKVATVAFLLQITICILEIYTSFRLPVSPFSSYLHYFGRGASDSLQGVSAVINTEKVPTGFQWNPNNLATTMGIVFPFFLFHKKAKVKWLGVISVVLIVMATESRANSLALLFMLVVSLLLYNKRKLLVAMPVILSLYFFMTPIVHFLENNFYNSPLGAGIINSANAVNNALTGENERGDSIDVRKQLIHDGLDALQATNGIGIGGGASKVIHSIDSEPMHNFWIETLVEGGILFFVLFVVWYASIALKLLRISYRTKNETLAYYSSSSCVAMIGFIPGAISPSSTIYLLPMWLMFGFAIAVINTHSKTAEQCVPIMRKQVA